MNDNYSAASGQGIYAGRFNNTPLSYVSSGGVVEALASSSFTGYRVLTTAFRTEYRPRPHAGSSYDPSRNVIWMFGAETHNTVGQFQNSPLYFDVATGKINQCIYDDNFQGDYNVDADGYLWANADRTRPWGMHVYRAMYYNNATKELEVYYDSYSHSGYWPPSAPIAASARKAPIWYFNTNTYQWRTEWSAAIDEFVVKNTTNAATRVAGRGFYSIVSAGVMHLTEDKSSLSIESSPHNNRYHNYIFNHQNLLISFGGGVASATSLCSVHDLDDVPSSYVVMLSEFGVLSGWDITNQWSVHMGGGQILFGARRTADAMQGAFIFNVNNRTVTFTGHTYGPEVKPVSAYSMMAEWIPSQNCAVIISHKYDDNTFILGLRL